MIFHLEARSSHVVLVAVALSEQTGWYALVHNGWSVGRVALPVVRFGRKRCASQLALCSVNARIVSRKLTEYPGVHRQDCRLVSGELLTKGVASFALPGDQQDS